MDYPYRPSLGHKSGVNASHALQEQPLKKLQQNHYAPSLLVDVSESRRAGSNDASSTADHNMLPDMARQLNSEMVTCDLEVAGT